MKKGSTVVIALLAILAVVFGILFISGNGEKGDLTAKVDSLTKQLEEQKAESAKAIEEATATAKAEADELVANVKAEAEEAQAKAVEEAVAAAKKEAEEAQAKAVEEAVAAAKTEAEEAHNAAAAESAEAANTAAEEAKAKAVEEAVDAVKKEAEEAQAKAVEDAVAAAKQEAETATEKAVEEAVAKVKEESDAVIAELNTKLEETEAARAEMEVAKNDAEARAAEMEGKVAELEAKVEDLEKQLADALAGAAVKTEEVAAVEAPAEAPAEEAAAEEAVTEEAATEAAAEEAIAETAAEAPAAEPAAETPAAEPAAEAPAVMDHAAYAAAELESPVVVETYVQAHQAWYEGNVTVYAQSPDGAYFIYNMACSEEDAAKLVPGTKIRVEGYKGEWAGEVEIMDATFTFLEGDPFIAEAEDVTAKLGTDDLIGCQNELVCFKGLTVVAYDETGAAFAYKNAENKTDDLYFKVSLNGEEYAFCVEYYLCNEETEVYKAVESLNVGDVIDAEGFLYWYNGANPHITKITKAE